MKNFLRKVTPLLVVIVLAFSCHPSYSPSCRVDKILWSGEWHKASYNGSGRLTLLEGSSTNIYFHYNGSNQLEKAEIVSPSQTTRFEFIHGPYGIVETNYWDNLSGEELRFRQVFTYDGPTKIDKILYEEYGDSGSATPTFTDFDDFTYNANNNVISVDGLFTFYDGLKYDKKENPFRLLAVAVGNPVFFPVCKMAPFPLSNYHMGFLNLFSRNNPVRAAYTVQSVPTDPQTFFNSYSGSLASKIVWQTDAYPASAETYQFEFDCRFGIRDDD